MKTETKKQLVEIEWLDPQHDWHYFHLLGIVGEMVHLQGADIPDGSAKHTGDSFWVSNREIKSMVDVQDDKPSTTLSACTSCEFNTKPAPKVTQS